MAAFSWWSCPQVRPFASHSITKAIQKPLVVLLIDSSDMWSITTSFVDVECVTEHASLFTDEWPSLKWLYHSICVLPIASSPKFNLVDCFNLRIANLETKFYVLCSTCSESLSKQQYNCYHLICVHSSTAFQQVSGFAVVKKIKHVHKVYLQL